VVGAFVPDRSSYIEGIRNVKMKRIFVNEREKGTGK
jgi:hypothetical protein